MDCPDGTTCLTLDRETAACVVADADAEVGDAEVDDAEVGDAELGDVGRDANSDAADVLR